MGQGEILELLDELQIVLTAREISEYLKLPPNKISRCLTRLVHFKEVKFIEVSRDKLNSLLLGKIPHRRTRFFFSAEWNKERAHNYLKLRKVSISNGELPYPL